MKEAAGEANMTVITIVLIGVVLAAGTLLVSNLMGSTSNSSCCTSSGGIWYKGACYSDCTETNGVKTCTGSFAPKCD